MDHGAFALSLRLAFWTLVILMPLGLLAGRWLADHPSRWRPLAEAALALPLVLPPTVLGYYLLRGLGATAPLGAAWQSLFGGTLVFSFQGLVVASVIVNLPFAVQPVLRAYEALAPEIREAAQCCGMAPLTAFRRVELPLVWPGLLSALVLTFAHTLGEFGVVLMVGGNIPGETRTVAIAIYDRVQAFDDQGAGLMSALLVLVSLLAIGLTMLSNRRPGGRGDVPEGGR